MMAIVPLFVLSRTHLQSLRIPAKVTGCGAHWAEKHRVKVPVMI